MFRSTLLGAAKRVYGMTEGQYLIPKTYFISAPGVTCNSAPSVTFRDDCVLPADRSYCDSAAGRITMCQDSWGSSAVLAHEYAHCILDLADEYWEHPTEHYTLAQCGHTLMGETRWWLNNVCAGKSGLGFSEHPKNPRLGAPVMTGYLAPDWNTGWYRLKSSGRVYNQMFGTPSNYDFYNHDFNGEIAVVNPW